MKLQPAKGGPHGRSSANPTKNYGNHSENRGGIMKIAIGTDDKETIRKGHFCQSRYYFIVEFLNAEVASLEYRRNAGATGEHGPYHDGQVEKTLELLSDCNLFMAKRMGKRSLAKLAAHGIDCIITDIDAIDRAVGQYLYGGDEAFQFYDGRNAKLIPCSQRTAHVASPSSKNL
jgi:predicted Fe-Mo cluster-binding NifX family protein